MAQREYGLSCSFVAATTASMVWQMYLLSMANYTHQPPIGWVGSFFLNLGLSWVGFYILSLLFVPLALCLTKRLRRGPRLVALGAAGALLGFGLSCFVMNISGSKYNDIYNLWADAEDIVFVVVCGAIGLVTAIAVWRYQAHVPKEHDRLL